MQKQVEVKETRKQIRSKLQKYINMLRYKKQKVTNTKNNWK